MMSIMLREKGSVCFVDLEESNYRSIGETSDESVLGSKDKGHGHVTRQGSRLISSVR